MPGSSLLGSRFLPALLALSLLALAALAGDPNAPADAPLYGFNASQAKAQRDLESRFDSVLEADNLRQWMQRISARPHHVGSPYGKENAEFIAELFRSWGYETRIEVFDVLFPTPKTRHVELLAPTPFVASLTEPPIAEDTTSALQDEQLPIYNAYSVDGDVTGDLVYVNYGVREDYEELDRRGIDVAGKIVIARYGGSWRGIKPKVAAERGAIGCLLYSDPRNDGFFQGDAYPKGGYRTPQGAQRGSVMDFSLHNGDPLTPFVGATRNAERLDIAEAQTLTKIPTLPLSWQDALPLLRALEGPVAPPDWRGALPITYHLGPGPARVHLKVEFHWDVVPARDVIAVLPGSEWPDQWVIRGNHHDAWVFGAADPVSAMVALMEEARAVAKLALSGWRPRRTIVYAAWDGEEQGLLGSTEWVETHAEELREKAVAYVNSDGYSRGFLGFKGSHTLERTLNQVGREVTDPEKGLSVLERVRAAILLNGDPEARKEARDRPDLRLPPAGSGSDYTPFLHHLGIASLNLGYGGEGEYGQYHSIYDSFDHYLRFMDPTFEYGLALAQTAGRLVLRLADAEVLPFEFTAFADSVGRYVKEITELTATLRQETEEKNRLIEDGIYEAVADPQKPFVVPEPKEPVPYVNFAPLQNALARLERSAREFDKASAAWAAGEVTLSPEVTRELNRILMHTERALIRAEGLPRRPWYRHQIYAPGVYTGYAPKTMPSVREALEDRNFAEAEAQIVIVAATLERFAGEIDRATAILRGVGK